MDKGDLLQEDNQSPCSSLEAKECFYGPSEVAQSQVTFFATRCYYLYRVMELGSELVVACNHKFQELAVEIKKEFQ